MLKCCLILLVYSVADFSVMLYTGYHSLVTIATFWACLACCCVCATLHQTSRYRRALKRSYEQRELDVWQERRYR